MLSLVDIDGRRGFGEASPLPGFSIDAFGEVEACLRAVTVRPLALSTAQDVTLETSVPAINKIITRWDVPEHLPSARFAVESALVDLFAQRAGVDAASLLHERHAPLDSIETSALLHDAGDVDAFVERGLAAIASGFHTVKVKLRAMDGQALGREIEGLTALRRAAPANLELRLDPNGRWSIEQARDYLARLAIVGPAFVEQPVRPEELALLGQCAVPWAADESLQWPELVERLARDPGCGAFIVKPATLGLLRGRALVKKAREYGLCAVVTHFMDGAVGLAAACELALSLEEAPAACGLDPHAGLRGPGRAALPHHATRGVVTRSGKGGLGVG